jgi:hypothetical protein
VDESTAMMQCTSKLIVSHQQTTERHIVMKKIIKIQKSVLVKKNEQKNRNGEQNSSKNDSKNMEEKSESVSFFFQ